MIFKSFRARIYCGLMSQTITVMRPDNLKADLDKAITLSYKRLMRESGFMEDSLSNYNLSMLFTEDDHEGSLPFIIEAGKRAGPFFLEVNYYSNAVRMRRLAENESKEFAFIKIDNKHQGNLGHTIDFDCVELMYLTPDMKERVAGGEEFEIQPEEYEAIHYEKNKRETGTILGEIGLETDRAYV